MKVLCDYVGKFTKSEVFSIFDFQRSLDKIFVKSLLKAFNRGGCVTPAGETFLNAFSCDGVFPVVVAKHRPVETSIDRNIILATAKHTWSARTRLNKSLLF